VVGGHPRQERDRNRPLTAIHRRRGRPVETGRMTERPRVHRHSHLPPMIASHASMGHATAAQRRSPARRTPSGTTGTDTARALGRTARDGAYMASSSHDSTDDCAADPASGPPTPPASPSPSPAKPPTNTTPNLDRLNKPAQPSTKAAWRGAAASNAGLRPCELDSDARGFGAQAHRVSLIIVRELGTTMQHDAADERRSCRSPGHSSRLVGSTPTAKS
jgi:hypothetical protein